MTWPSYSRECIADVVSLLKRGGSLSSYRASSAFPDWIGPKEGSQAYAFEREVEAAFSVRHCVAVNSGTAALHAALVSLGVHGREVVTSPYTFSASVASIILAGGIPRFADIDPCAFCITAETVKPHITKRTAAILPVSLFGYYPDYSDLRQFGKPIMVDQCQAVGAQRGGAYLGRDEAAQAFSFNGSKQLPTGEGGALVTNDSNLAEKARLFCNHSENFGLRFGRPSRTTELVGVNYRMQEVVACIARHGLKELPARNYQRRRLAVDVFAQLRLRHGVSMELGKISTRENHVYYVVPLMLPSNVNRARFIRRCAKRELAVQAGYTLPLHHLPAFKKYAKGPLPVVDDVHGRLCLLTTLTPDRPLKYADEVAEIIAESLK